MATRYPCAHRKLFVFLLFVAASFLSATPLLAAGDKPEVQGELIDVDGVRVLRVWGDARARGFAHGYLMAKDIVELIDGYLAAEKISGGPKRFNSFVRNLDYLMSVPGPYLTELDGMLAGINERLGDDAKVPALGRALTRQDLVAINCVPDSVGFGCSSFAAWGNRTADGKTVAGRNLDWHTIDALRSTQLVVANMPDENSKQAAWVSVTWPGMIICLTGMNERGVTVSMHDAMVGSPRNAIEMTPRGFALRLAVEAARPQHVEEDILGVLKKHRVMVGNIVPVSVPTTGDGPSSLVFEYDGSKKNSSGVTVRHASPEGDAGDYQIATNHYRERAAATSSCNRYEKLKSTFEATKDDPAVTIKRAWKLLKRVAMDGGIITYQSVVFKPDQRRMHVSFSTKDGAAPNGKRVMLDVAKLLKRPVTVAASGS